MQTTTLFQKLGGAPVVRAVVDDFYSRVLGDPTLAPFFESTDMPAQRAHLAAFVGVVLGGPDAYRGRSMREAHRGRRIGDTDFDAVAGHLAATLTDAGVTIEDTTTILTAIASLRPEVVENTAR